MAYSLPELVLAGAAQNLVLTCSADKGPFCIGDGITDLDPGPELYNGDATW